MKHYTNIIATLVNVVVVVVRVVSSPPRV